MATKLIDEEGSTVIYYPNYVSHTESLSMYDLSVTLNYIQPNVTVWAKTVPTPRLQYAAGDLGGEGVVYGYSGAKIPLNKWNDPEDIPTYMLKHVRDYIVSDKSLMKLVSDDYSVYPNSCLVNYYRNGEDNVGWHYDKETNDSMSSVITISLGCSRKFRFRKRDDHKITKEVLLNSGDLILMCGNTQKLWEHTIPKVAISKCNSGRVSLTYRVI